jgi:hypothetical protein
MQHGRSSAQVPWWKVSTEMAAATKPRSARIGAVMAAISSCATIMARGPRLATPLLAEDRPEHRRPQADD